MVIGSAPAGRRQARAPDMTAPHHRTWHRRWQQFPLGPAPLIIFALTVISGGFLLLRPTATQGDGLVLWTFAKEHVTCYEAELPAFQAAMPGTPIQVKQVDHSAIYQRLSAAMAAGVAVPDIVDVEISWTGPFFRGPIEEIGFVDLVPYLRRDGLLDRFLPSRFAPYTVQGRVFGLPHDVDPVMIAYRRDLLEAEGIDAGSLTTMEALVSVGRRLTRLGDDGRPPRYLVQAQTIEPFLFQRDGGYFDAQGRLRIDDEIAVQTMCWYVPLVAGPGRIAVDMGWGATMSRAMQEGLTLMFICPDWYARSFENDNPQLSGKMALMPLPAVTPGGRRTSTWGGTMIGITKSCRDPERAWALLKHLFASPAGWDRQWNTTGILPGMPESWTRPAIAAASPYWSGAAHGLAYAQLAPAVPPQYTSPYIDLAKGKYQEVMFACCRQWEAHGDDGFVEFVRERLTRAADEVRRQMTRNPF